MYSLAFPDMFTLNTVQIVKDKDATLSNLKLLIGSDKFSLLGDPYFGTNIKKFIYEQNNTVFRDLLQDELYTAIRIFIPQVTLKRSDIKIVSDHEQVFAQIYCINTLDNTPNLYSIRLTDSEE